MTLPDGLFSRFKKILSSGIGAKQEFIDACKETCGVALTPKEIDIKDTIVRITGSVALKNKLFTAKSALLEELKKRNSSIKDIKF